MPDPTNGHDFTAGTVGAVPTEADAVAEIAVAGATPYQLDQTQKYSVVVPDGHRVETIDPERFLPTPMRARGVYSPATVDAFIAHVSRHRDEDHTTIWVHPTEGRIVAVLNDHAAAATGWRDHRSQLALTHTDEWLFWLGKDGRLMGQTEFAEHIEDGLTEIVEPAGADMLELAQTFHAHREASFRSATRLHDGRVQVRYDEEVEAKAGTSGEMEVPTEFKLSIAPFLGEPPWAVTARLRYRLRSGTLTLGYRLERPKEIVRQTLADVATRLTEQFPGTVFLGEPPA